jgi:hypothetical protein
MSEHELLPEVALAEVVNRVVKSDDHDRLHSMCSLLNTFNYAVQVQSNRSQWEAQDFRAFAISLCAMDAIGQAHKEIEQSISDFTSRRLREA